MRRFLVGVGAVLQKMCNNILCGSKMDRPKQHVNPSDFEQLEDKEDCNFEIFYYQLSVERLKRSIKRGMNPFCFFFQDFQPKIGKHINYAHQCLGINERKSANKLGSAIHKCCPQVYTKADVEDYNMIQQVFCKLKCNFKFFKAKTTFSVFRLSDVSLFEISFVFHGSNRNFCTHTTPSPTTAF